MLDYHDLKLQNMSYNAFSHLLIHRFCEGLLSRDFASATDIYIKYKNEWNKICISLLNNGTLKAKIEASFCYIFGHTFCKFNSKKRVLK